MITAIDILNHVVNNIKKENPTVSEVQDEFRMSLFEICDNDDFEKGSVSNAIDLINKFYGFE